MRLMTRFPTLTGVAPGGVMVRPLCGAVGGIAPPVTLRTTWICRLTLAPPIETLPPPLRPTLLTERAVGPGVG